MTGDDPGGIDGRRDHVRRTRIRMRVDGLVQGNPGQRRVLSGIVCERKIDVGPGCRVDGAERGGVLVVIPAGCDRSSQAAFASRHKGRRNVRFPGGPEVRLGVDRGALAMTASGYSGVVVRSPAMR